MSYKKWVLVAISLFGIGLVSGLVAPFGLYLADETMTYIEELSGILAPFSFFTAIFIFVKNTSVLLLSFIFSPILCLMPVLSLAVNGALVTIVSTAVIQEKSLVFLLSGLLPHGVFEIPALIMGQAAALSFGTMAILALVKREKRSLLLPNLKRNLKYLMLALGLFVPAAIIETYLTPLLLT